MENSKDKTKEVLSILAGGVLPTISEEENNRIVEEKRKTKEEEHIKKVKSEKANCFGIINGYNCTFANDDNADKELSENASKYVRNFDEMLKAGRGLILYGEGGTGKTYMSYAICNQLIEEGYKCKVIKSTSACDMFTDIYGMKIKQSEIERCLKSNDLIVIEDYGKQYTDKENEVMFALIDARKEQGKPMIVTTNLSGEEISKPKDSKDEFVIERIKEVCIPVPAKYKRRNEICRKNYEMFQRLE